jgi:hypothetical protein
MFELCSFNTQRVLCSTHSLDLYRHFLALALLRVQFIEAIPSTTRDWLILPKHKNIVDV